MEKTMQKLPEEIKNSLKELTSEEVINLRLAATENQFVIIKIGEKIYFTPIKKSEQAEKIRNAFEEHLCCDCGNFFCNEELCPKVADLSEETYRKYFRTRREAVIESKRIEKYPFILRGAEYVNIHNSGKEYLIVEECSRYTKNNDQEERKALWEQMQKEADEARRKLIYQSPKQGNF